MAYFPEYLWMVIVGFFFGFIYAFGIGANDVANAFGSTVASKSLTLKQAILVAAIFEFLGALLLGASVTSTVRSGIFDPAQYEDDPDIVLLGQFATIITGTLMLLTATYYGLPVSTTHTIVASTMGFSIVAKGFSSINWETVISIIVSWVISPLVSCIVAFLFFGSIKLFIFKHENTFERAYYLFPVVLTIFIGVDIFYVIYKGFNNKDFTDELNIGAVLGIAFGVGLAVGLFWIVWWGPRAKARIIKRERSC
jgi:solute carrier family 20 (sodium-dependent phosphate transporter)